MGDLVGAPFAFERARPSPEAPTRFGPEFPIGTFATTAYWVMLATMVKDVTRRKAELEIEIFEGNLAAGSGVCPAACGRVDGCLGGAWLLPFAFAGQRPAFALVSSRGFCIHNTQAERKAKQLRAFPPALLFSTGQWGGVVLPTA